MLHTDISHFLDYTSDTTGNNKCDEPDI
jgi:hypothetical protein